MLTSFVLTLHDDSGWNVSESDGRFGFVDVLAAGTSGAQGISSGRVRANLARHDASFNGASRHHRHRLQHRRA